MRQSDNGTTIAEALDAIRFYPDRGASHRCPPDWTIDNQRVADYDLWLVRDGCGRLQTKDGSTSLSAGDVLLFRPGDVISARHDRAHRLHVQYTHFLPDVPALFDQLGIPARSTVSHGQVWNAFDSFFEAASVACVPPAMRMKSLVLALVTDLLVQRRMSGQAHRRSESGRMVVMRAVGFLRSHLDRSVARDELCDASGVSRSTLSRLFARHLGQTPMKTHTRMRLQRGHALLRAGVSVASVADQLGYADPFSFSHAFKRETGWAPAEVCRAANPHEL